MKPHQRTINRCAWAKNELAVRYHDEEWGVPVHDAGALFEFLVLEGAQAGLSWNTILKKRDHYRRVFDNFDPARVANYSEQKIEALLADQGIIRNRLKVQSAVKNARAFLQIQEKCGSFSAYAWRFVDGRTLRNAWSSVDQIPARTAASDAMSKDLKKSGFSFVGSTICYAFMQAVGMVNDHTQDCFRYQQV